MSEPEDVVHLFHDLEAYMKDTLYPVAVKLAAVNMMRRRLVNTSPDGVLEFVARLTELAEQEIEMAKLRGRPVRDPRLQAAFAQGQQSGPTNAPLPADVQRQVDTINEKTKALSQGTTTVVGLAERIRNVTDQEAEQDKRKT